MTDARHDRLYEEACGLVDGLILLDDQPTPELTAAGRTRLGGALRLFEEVVRLRPSNWAAFWLMGKVYQRLGEHGPGLECFTAAHRIRPDQSDVAREAAIAAMNLGQPEAAIGFCERAIAAKPDDAGLRANLALALLFSGRPADAAVVADDALSRSPADEITAQIVGIIREVLTGTRACPRHVRDLH